MSDPVRNPASVMIVTMTLAMSPMDDFRSIDMSSVLMLSLICLGPLWGERFLIETSPPTSRTSVTLVDVTSFLIVVPDYAVGRKAIKPQVLLAGQSGLFLGPPEHFLSDLPPGIRTHDCELVDVTRVWTRSVPEYRMAPLKCNCPDHVISYSGKKDFFLMDLCKKSLSH